MHPVVTGPAYSDRPAEHRVVQIQEVQETQIRIIEEDIDLPLILTLAEQASHPGLHFPENRQPIMIVGFNYSFCPTRAFITFEKSILE